jgi:AraC family transcriptional regulator
MEVRIEDFKPVRVAYMRHHGPYETCHETWMRFNDWCKGQSFKLPHPLVTGVSYDDPETTPPEQIRYDCCIEVDENFQADEHVKVQELQGGEFAIYTLKGPYSEIAPTFRKLFREWLPQSGRECIHQACLEIYRNDPSQTPEDELLTDICIPLKSQA